jgi:cation diffusion facilitator CzcD-associated flavoprotein CzcO
MSSGSAGPAHDVLVIGGGQAGLAMGYHLAQSGLSFQIVDAGAEIGQTWRSRWDSLRLVTSGRYDNLPGLPFPAAPDAYPGKDDVTSYLQAYAAAFDLPVSLNARVTHLSQTQARPDFIIGSSRRRLHAAGVRFRPRLAGADGCTVHFAGGSALDVGVVIWASGYRPDYSWIHMPGLTRDGQVAHRRGVTGVPGLYFLGLTWHHTRGSALLGFVNHDAAYLAGRIAAHQRATDAATAGPAPSLLTDKTLATQSGIRPRSDPHGSSTACAWTVDAAEPNSAV